MYRQVSLNILLSQYYSAQSGELSGRRTLFKIKRSTKLHKLQGAYASKVGKDIGSIRFLYDGERIKDDDTPASLDMEDNDTIDVIVER
ncbi:ubiquitin-like protein, partial [Mycena olivaceomarginata]